MKTVLDWSLHSRILWIGTLLLCVGLLWGVYDHYKCKSASCLLQSDNELSKQFDPHIPLFMEFSSSSHLLETVMAFRDDPKIHHMLDMLTENVRRMRQTASPSPTCAVVGNSQNLLGSNYGTLIDSHDYVFRMNSAPVSSYEHDVGSRTTHHIFSHYYSGNYNFNGEIHIRLYSPNTFNILIPLHSDPNVPFSATYERKDYAVFGKFFANLADALSNHESFVAPLTRDNMTEIREIPNLLVFSPDFLWYANFIWFNPQEKQKKDIASTGFITMILALHLCDQIDLFGFGATPDGAWAQYFSENKDRPVRHHPGYQEQFIDSLEAKHLIKVYRGKQ